MDAFLKEIDSSIWWLSVVLVGVLINIFSAYLKSGIDFCLSCASLKYKNFIEAQKEKEEALINHLSSSAEERIEFLEEERRFRFKALINGMFALGLILFFLFLKMSFIIGILLEVDSTLTGLYMRQLVLWSSLVPVLSSFRNWHLAEQIHGLIKEAKKRSSH